MDKKEILIAVVEFLIKKGADVNAKSSN